MTGDPHFSLNNEIKSVSKKEATKEPEVTTKYAHKKSEINLKGFSNKPNESYIGIINLRSK